MKGIGRWWVDEDRQTAGMSRGSWDWQIQQTDMSGGNGSGVSYNVSSFVFIFDFSILIFFSSIKHDRR